jgi:hypothetical protein
LRLELERAEVIREEAVQKAVASEHGEVTHFKRIVNALRDELELKGNLHDEKIQQENQLKTMEFKQLQETIVELRDELEKSHGN